jgi:DNA-binding transcriptional LysR family regulator
MLEPRIDLNLLSVFQEVYRERQISSAARRLGLTQSAVSNALARLRRTFGDELFVRTAHGMQPTPLAAADGRADRRGDGQVALALSQRSRFDPATSTRRFTLAMTDVGEVYFMPVLIERCRALAPFVSRSRRCGPARWTEGRDGSGPHRPGDRRLRGRVGSAFTSAGCSASLRQHVPPGHPLAHGQGGPGALRGRTHLFVDSRESPTTASTAAGEGRRDGARRASRCRISPRCRTSSAARDWW